jgi:high-affinity iron transporter
MVIVRHSMLVLPVLLLLGWVPPALGEGNPLRGKYTYQEYCASCHGSKGDGKGLYADALDPKPMDFTEGEFHCCETDRDLFEFITDGQEPMPSWSAIPDSDRWDLIAYVRTLKKK